MVTRVHTVMDDDGSGDFGCWETWVRTKGVSDNGWQLQGARPQMGMPGATAAERARVLVISMARSCVPNGAWHRIRYGRKTINGACCKLGVGCSCLVRLAGSWTEF